MPSPKPSAAFRRACLDWMPRLMADLGLDRLDAAAVLGNAGHESAGLTLMQELRPTVPGSRGGLGAFQWTGPRRRAFEAWLKRRGAAPGDLDASYAFLLRELRGPERLAIAATREAEGLEAKVRAFERTYERAGVKHYPSRIAWARLALAIHDAARSSAAEPAAHVRSTAEPVLAPATWWERFVGARPPLAAPVGINRGDAVLFRQQNRLLAAGYTEVGDPDGLWGPNTRGAVALALSEQAPELPAPADWPLTDAVLAALAKLERRRVAAERAAVTVAELRARGSTPIKAPVQLVGGGGLLGLLGLGKAIGETGLAERIAAATDGASEIAAGIQAVVAPVTAALSLVYRFWWAILVALGLFWILRGLRWALEIRALARQGTIRQTGL